MGKVILKIAASLFIAAFFVFVHDGPRYNIDSFGNGCMIFICMIFVFFVLAPVKDEIEYTEEYSRESPESEDPEEILP